MLLRRHERDAVTRAKLLPEDPAVLLMSGGTTGTAKAALGTHGAYMLTGLQIKAWIGSLLRDEHDVYLVPLPLFHVYANVGIQSLAFVNGGTLALVPNPRDLKDLLATIKRVKPTFLCGVPTLFIAFLNHPDVQGGKIDFSSIRVCFSGAAALMAETKAPLRGHDRRPHRRRLFADRGDDGAVRQPGAGTNKLGSVGMPLPDVSVRIYDAEEGTRALPAKEVGEICLAGAAADGRVLEPAGRDGSSCCASTRLSVRTPARGVAAHGRPRLSRRRRLRVHRRSQEGHDQDERVPGVAARNRGSAGDARRGGRGRRGRQSDPVKGEVVHAWVVLRAGQTATEQDLRAFCREQLAAYKVPARVEFRDSLPKTMVGKVLRRALKEELKAAQRP